MKKYFILSFLCCLAYNEGTPSLAPDNNEKKTGIQRYIPSLKTTLEKEKGILREEISPEQIRKDRPISHLHTKTSVILPEDETFKILDASMITDPGISGEEDTPEWFLMKAIRYLKPLKFPWPVFPSFYLPRPLGIGTFPSFTHHTPTILFHRSSALFYRPFAFILEFIQMPLKLFNYFMWDNFEWCPNEVLMHILSYLSIEDLVTISQTNKRLYFNVHYTFYCKASEIIRCSFENNIIDKEKAALAANVFISEYLPNIATMQKIIQSYSRFWGGKHKKFFAEINTILTPSYFKAIDEFDGWGDYSHESSRAIEKIDKFFKETKSPISCLLF